MPTIPGAPTTTARRPPDPGDADRPLPSELRSSEAGAATLVEVAVPGPLPPLVYSEPASLQGLLLAGCRVRVPMGKRRVTGFVVGACDHAPEGVAVRPVETLLDLDPVLSEQLLELGRFTARYYMVSLGEVLRSMIPADLPGTAAAKVRLTSLGAAARPRDEGEARLLARLLSEGHRTVGELAHGEQGSELLSGLERLEKRGWIRLEGTPKRGARYRTAVELPAGDLERQVEACGRSQQGREVVELLHALGRPATLAELTSAVGCSDGVVRRLVERGLLRRFTQIERLPLDHHILNAERETARHRLRPEQERALVTLEDALRKGRFAPFLLLGVTGSGKTEVYLRAAETVVARQGSVLLLVPEIALVPQLAQGLRARFGDLLAILHSGLSRSERQQEWLRIQNGEARVVLGPRSALFAPVRQLGLIVVDEEHEEAYKQGTSPRYNARDLALVRARAEAAVAVLVSATPSLETRYNVERRRYGFLDLKHRVGEGELPQGILVDLRKEVGAKKPGEVHFSPTLSGEIDSALAAGDQIILLRNRRGYAPVLLCRACGEDHRCEDCGLPMTFHQKRRRLVCHYCDHEQAAPERCQKCGEAALEPIGTGTERVEETFRQKFPGVQVGVLDRDRVRERGGVAAILESFASGKLQVLIGTQMVAKGHHFPRVALAAVLLADSYLTFPDFRAVEKTYSLLTQLAGRAGRGDRPGRVVIQTYHPDHYAIRAVLSQDDAAFASEEMRFRRIFHYPPYARLILVTSRDKNRQVAEQRLRELSARLEQHPQRGTVRVSGPAPAPLERIRGYWRFQLLVRGDSSSHLRQLIQEVAPPLSNALLIDVDPVDLL